MRIALVNPVTRNCQGYHTGGTRIPQLGLQVLAQLVPDGHQVEIIDEIFGTDDTDSLLTSGRYDLVGITSYTSTATRAYELADLCRKRGIPCIMGGPHASAVPEEAAQHFDSVAIGECDEIWPEIIADAAAGNLKPKYEGQLADLPAGRGAAAQQLSPINGKYNVACIQTSRGCPVGCEYCSVTRFNGKEIRRRPINEIVDEWNSIDKKFVFIVDDNFYGISAKHSQWSKELLHEIIRRGKKRLWFSQTSINMGSDPEGLKLAYKAGCRGMLVGIESFNPVTLKEFNKGLNCKLAGDYGKLIDGFHKGGIAMFGCFVIGADNDDKDTVFETMTKAMELGVDIVQITNLTPLPGTRLYERWMEEEKIVRTDYPKDWERYSFTDTVYTPDGMTREDMDTAVSELRQIAATVPWVWKRTLKALYKTRSLTTALFVHGMNKGFMQLAKQQLSSELERFGPMQDTPRTRSLRRVIRNS